MAGCPLLFFRARYNQLPPIYIFSPVNYSIIIHPTRKKGEHGDGLSRSLHHTTAHILPARWRRPGDNPVGCAQARLTTNHNRSGLLLFPSDGKGFEIAHYPNQPTTDTNCFWGGGGKIPTTPSRPDPPSPRQEIPLFLHCAPRNQWSNSVQLGFPRN